MAKKKKKALVTGAAGFCGERVLDLLVKKGYEVRATDLESAPREHIDKLGVEYIPADLTKPEQWPKLVKDVDVIFNIAAAFNYHMPWELMEKINVQGGKNLCDAVVKHNPNLKVFVHWSTAEVYGYNMLDKTHLPPNEELTEDYDYITPGESPYAKTKWLQEQLVWKYHKEKGLPAISLRLGTVYGPGLFFTRLINIFADMVALRSFPKNITFKWPLVYVGDVADAAIFVSEKKEAIGKVFIVVDEQDYNFSDMIYAIAEYLKMPLRDVPLPPLSHLWKMVHLTSAEARKPLLNIIKAAHTTLSEEVTKEGGRVWFTCDYAVKYLDIILGMKELADNFKCSNQGLKKLGWKPKCPAFKNAVPEMIEWAKKHRVLVKKPGLKHLLTKGLLM